MSEMVERVAKALSEHLYGDDETWGAAALGAIMAMRDPTRPMKRAGNAYLENYADSGGVWNVMLDEIINGSA